jgi:hypothetical protein
MLAELTALRQVVGGDRAALEDKKRLVSTMEAEGGRLVGRLSNEITERQTGERRLLTELERLARVPRWVRWLFGAA